MARAAGRRVAHRHGKTRGVGWRGACRAETLEARRLLSAGDLDPSFGAGGTLVTDFPGSAGDRGRQIALQPDGKVLEVAWHQGFSALETVLAVTRFNADGSTDTGFGDNGLAVVDYPDRGEWLPSIALAPGGKIVVGTWAGNPPNDIIATDSDYLVARLNPDGKLDTTFDGDGMKLIDFGTTAGGPGAAKTVDYLLDLAVQADGKVIAAGFVSIGGKNVFGLARLNLDGSLDTTFDGDGVVTAPLGTTQVQLASLGASSAVSVAIDSSGRIVVAGGAGATAATSDFAVARYNPDGTFDTTFDGDGWTLTPFGTSRDSASNVAIAPDGKIVVCGVTFATSTAASDMAVARYNADGSLDATFSGDGKAVFGLASGATPSTEEAVGLAVQDDGAVLMSATTTTNVNPRTSRRILGRLDASGNPDGSFGNGGVADSQLTEALSVAVQSDGQILLGGIVTRPSGTFEDFAVERVDAFGTSDGSFGDGGLASADFAGPGFNLGRAGAVQPDGKIIAAGVTVPTVVNRDLALARYNPNGTLDRTFGTGGRRVIDLAAEGFGYTSADLTAITLEADGHIVLVGSVIDPSRNNLHSLLVARLNPDGSLDTGFAGAGVQVLSDPLAPDAELFAQDVLVQPDRKIVVVGKYAGAGGVNEFLVVRLGTAGVTDQSFGPFPALGLVHTQVNGTDSEANAAVLIPNQAGGGRDIIVAGRARNASSRDEFALVRYNPDGTLDTDFDADGKLTTSMGSGNAAALDVVVDAAGKIVAAGYALGPGTFSSLRQDFAVARYTGAGALDPSFDVDGKVTTDFKKGVDRANSILVLDDGTYLAGGQAENAPDTANSQIDFALVHYGAAGELVTSFGTGGKLTTNIDPTPASNSPLAGRDEIFELLAYPGGRVVAVGNTVSSKTGNDFSAARYLLAGTPPAQVVGEYLFYNHSKFDDNDPAITDADLRAVASDKQALRPGGSAGFNNTTSYTRGLNGLMVLVQGATSPTAADFVFKAGTSNDPATWAAAPAPSGFQVRPTNDPGATVLFTFPDGALRNTWLQVTVLANDRTRLVAPHVFYFGNLVGNSDSMFFLRVDTLDVYRARYFYSTRDVTSGNRYDFNKDGVVNVLDQAIARANVSASLVTLTPPAAAAANIVHESSVGATGLLAAGRAVPPRRSILQT